MLTPRIVHSTVDNHGQAVGFSEVGNLLARRDTATPCKIRLEDIDKALGRRVGERLHCVPVFSGCKNDARKSIADALVSIQVLWEQIVFQPLDPIWAQGFAETDGVLHVQRNPCIDHYLYVRSNLLTGLRNQFLSPADRADATLRTFTKEYLDRPKPKFKEPLDAIRGSVRQVGVAGVAVNCFLLGSPEKLIDGTTKNLPLEVPKCNINGTHGVTGKSG